jgi:predicted lipoprotein with Yx(FWY)xxD motif
VYVPEPPLEEAAALEDTAGAELVVGATYTDEEEVVMGAGGGTYTELDDEVVTSGTGEVAKNWPPTALDEVEELDEELEVVGTTTAGALVEVVGTTTGAVVDVVDETTAELVCGMLWCLCVFEAEEVVETVAGSTQTVLVYLAVTQTSSVTVVHTTFGSLFSRENDGTATAMEARSVRAMTEFFMMKNCVVLRKGVRRRRVAQWRWIS